VLGWYRKYKQEGNYTAKKRGDSKRKIDVDELEKYVKGSENMTLKEAAQKFDMSIFTISYWLKNLGHSYKKKTFPTCKKAKKSVRYIKKI
jgi:transposase